jgi:hypothetical protein
MSHIDAVKALEAAWRAGDLDTVAAMLTQARCPSH